MGLDRLLSQLEVVGEGFALVPFGFTINGTSDPDGLIGKTFSAWTRAEAGEFSGTLAANTTPYVVYAAFAAVSVTADDTDMLCMCDWSTAGTLVVRTMTGAVETDPSDNLLVGGFLLVKKNDR